MIEKIKNMTPDQLEFYKNLISFFELLGITEEDLILTVKTIKGEDKAKELEGKLDMVIDRMNEISTDQSTINTKIMELEAAVHSGGEEHYEEVKEYALNGYK